MKYTTEVRSKQYSYLIVLRDEKGIIGWTDNCIAGIDAGKTKSILWRTTDEIKNRQQLRSKIKEIF